MSHRATDWLIQIPGGSLSGSKCLVLLHLCAAHNSKRDPKTACFPSQERLRVATGLSNGGLNNALNALEAAGLIRRRRTTEPGSARQRTYYILGCDFGGPHEQNPDIGDCSGEQTPLSDGAKSTFSGGKLQQSGEKPVSNMKKEPSRGRTGAHTPAQGGRAASAASGLAEGAGSAENGGAAGGAMPDDPVLFTAQWLNSGRYVPPNLVTNSMRDALLARGLVTEELLRAKQIY